MQSVILLPGMACDAETFAAQAPALQAAGYSLHISNVHSRFNSLPAMAECLLAEHCGVHTLIGHSMGGMLALEMARQAPQRVRGMALLGSTPNPDTPELIALRTKACELFAAGRMDEVLAANAMFAFHPVHAANRALVKQYLAMVSRGGPEALIRQNRAVMARADSRPLLPHLRCPVLVMCGEGDRLTPPELSREMAAAIQNARLELVAAAGHMLTMEQPARVTALLLDWLASLK
jgi:pimeloyl-ACP methyl ester carboxylesterase